MENKRNYLFNILEFMISSILNLQFHLLHPHLIIYLLIMTSKNGLFLLVEYHYQNIFQVKNQMIMMNQKRI